MEQTTPAVKTIEISHGSDYSKLSSRSTTPEATATSLNWILYSLIVVITLTVVILVPLFWYGNVGGVSDEMKKYISYREPVVITVAVLSVFIVSIIVLLACRSRRNRFEEGTVAKYIDKREKPGEESVVSAADESFVSQSSSHSVSFRQKLEELSECTIQEIRDILTMCSQENHYDISFSSRKEWPEWPNKEQRTLSHYNPEYVVHVRGDNVRHEDELQPGLRHSFVNYEVVCHNLRLKALLVGQSNVGKTSIFHRILYGQFSNTYITTLGCDVGVTNVHFTDSEGNKEVDCSVHLWDIGGNGLKYDLSNVMFRDTVLFLAVCEASSSNLSGLSEWITAIRSKVFEPNIAIFINKTDLTNVILSRDMIRVAPGYHNVQVFEVSAKTGAGVIDSFRTALINALLREASNFT